MGTICWMGFYIEEENFVFLQDQLGKLVREAHAGGLYGHFGKKRTLELLKDHFYWQGMLKDVHKVLEQCAMC